MVLCVAANTYTYEIEERENFVYSLFLVPKNKADVRPVLTIRVSLMRKIHLRVYPNEKEPKVFSVCCYSANYYEIHYSFDFTY